MHAALIITCSRKPSLACAREKLDSVNDLGVIFDSCLSFRDHIFHKINKAYSILGIIKRNFIYMDESSFILL